MILIDAAQALRILMPPGDTKAPDPHKEADLIERKAREGRLRLWGLRGWSPEPEPIPVEHLYALLFDWVAAPSETDDQLGELYLVAKEWPHEAQWRKVHSYREEIEAIKAEAEGRKTADMGADVLKSARAKSQHEQPKRGPLKQFFQEKYPGKDGWPEVPMSVTDDELVFMAQKVGFKDAKKDTVRRAVGRRKN